MRRLAIVGLVGAGLARADDAVELHDTAEPPGGLTRDPVGPLLKLDSPLRAHAEGSLAQDVDSDVAGEHVDLSLGRDTRARVESAAWSNELFGAQGWSAGLHLVHDFHVIQVGVGASVNRVDSIDVHQSYALLGVTLSRTFRLSRWMTGWVSLSLGQRRWLGGQPPEHDPDDNAGMLSFGTTFR